MNRSIHFGTTVLVLFGNAALAQQPTAAERVAALKASLAASQAILKQYEWVDYLKPGDTLSADVDLTNNHLLGMSVKTYLEDAKDTIALDARCAVLAEGSATYTDTITLNASKKKITVQVDNSGYRKLGS